MKIAVVVGTRPEIIKMSPIIRECERLQLGYYILHTGQHYSYSMDQVFFEQLKLPEPRYRLEVGSGSHGEQTGKILLKIENVLVENRPDVVLVEGDTNTVLAGALAAAKLHVKVGHVEAGLRSYDRMMPEEINRVLTDHCSDLLFAPTQKSKQTLLGEGVSAEKIFVTGNTVVDAVYRNRDIARDMDFYTMGDMIGNGDFFLVTIHRQENVDDPKRFRNILRGLQQVHEEFNVPVIYPVHPRARKMIEQFHLDTTGIQLIEPLDYFRFLLLEQDACIVLTDSGGVQEETCILGTPCVTLRDTTERPETLEVGSNILVGTDPDRIVEGVSFMSKKEATWVNPFGDGTAGKKIVAVLRKLL